VAGKGFYKMTPTERKEWNERMAKSRVERARLRAEEQKLKLEEAKAAAAEEQDRRDRAGEIEDLKHAADKMRLSRKIAEEKAKIDDLGFDDDDEDDEDDEDDDEDEDPVNSMVKEVAQRVLSGFGQGAAGKTGGNQRPASVAPTGTAKAVPPEVKR